MLFKRINFTRFFSRTFRQNFLLVFDSVCLQNLPDLYFLPILSRDAGGGGAGEHVPPPQVSGYQLTLFGPRGGRLCPPYYYVPPIFSDDAASLIFIVFSAWANVVLLSGSEYIRGQTCLFFYFFALFEWIGLKWGMKFQARKKLKIEIQELHCVHTRENCFKFCTPVPV